jgi:excinuclease ABC subunit C
MRLLVMNYIQINHGASLRSHTMEMKKQLDESDADLLQLAIVELHQI